MAFACLLLGASCGSDSLAARAPAPPVTLRTGATLHYVEQGNPAGEPVVLLHGYTDSSFSFARLIPLLPELRLLALDQRGHGRSGKDMPSHTMADMAADLHAFLDALGLDRVTLVGHCMGGVVALRFAAEHPERVARLVLLDATSTCGNAVTRGLLDEVRQCTARPDPEFVRAFQRSTVFAGVPDDFFAQVVEESLSVPLPVWQQALADFVTQDLTPSLPALRVPTLIVWGDRDEVFARADQEVLDRTIPDSTLHVVAACGHAPHWEAPEHVAEVIRGFVPTGTAAR